MDLGPLHGPTPSLALVVWEVTGFEASVAAARAPAGLPFRIVNPRQIRDFAGARFTTLRGLTPDEFTCRIWTEELKRFRLDPSQHMPGSNI